MIARVVPTLQKLGNAVNLFSVRSMLTKVVRDWMAKGLTEVMRLFWRERTVVVVGIPNGTMVRDCPSRA